LFALDLISCIDRLCSRSKLSTRKTRSVIRLGSETIMRRNKLYKGYKHSGRSLRIVLIAVVSWVLFASGLLKGQAGSNSHPILAHDEKSIRVIVELDGDGSVVARLRSTSHGLRRGGKLDIESQQAREHLSRIEAEQRDFLSRARLVVPDLQVGVQLGLLADAVSLEVSPAEVPLLATLPGVRRVAPARTMHAFLNRSLSIISAPAMWEALGSASVAGSGMKIAVLDTGIDISHPMLSDTGLQAPPGFPLGDSSFTNNKVIVAKAFLKKKKGRTPADEFGHGTAVAAVAAGRNNTPTLLGPISGVAPAAFLGNYRVLDAAGEGPDDLVAAGLEEAVKDGFDVANLSLGGTPTGELNFLDRTVEAAVAAGMIVVVAAGNEGNDGLETIAEPAEAPSSIAVGASTNSHTMWSGVVAIGPPPVPGDSGKLIGTTLCCRDFTAAIGPLPCVDVSKLDPQGGCNGLPPGSLSGRIVLIDAATDCSLIDRLRAAQSAGAAAAITLTIPAERIEGIPVMNIAPPASQVFREWVDSHSDANVVVTPLVEFESVSDVAASFSSLGPSVLGQLKPDVDAPGVMILTASPFSPLMFQPLSGTSLSAPHVAGAAALLKQLHPSWTPEQVKSALMSSAVSVYDDFQKFDFVDPLTAGAGRIDLSRALAVNATFSPASLSFGIKKLKKKHGRFVIVPPFEIEFQITNLTERPVIYSISLDQHDVLSLFTTIEFSPRSISLGPGEHSTVTMTVTIYNYPAVNNNDFTGQVLVEAPDNQTLHIPYWIRFGKVKNKIF